MIAYSSAGRKETRHANSIVSRRYAEETLNKALIIRNTSIVVIQYRYVRKFFFNLIKFFEWSHQKEHKKCDLAVKKSCKSDNYEKSYDFLSIKNPHSRNVLTGCDDIFYRSAT